MFIARILQPPAGQLTFQHVSVPVSAAQPPKGGLISSQPYIQLTGPGSQAPVTQVTGASVMSAASEPVSPPSTQTPVRSATVDVYLVARDFDMQETTIPVSQSSVVKPTSESDDVYQPPVTGATVIPSTSAAGGIL